MIEALSLARFPTARFVVRAMRQLDVGSRLGRTDVAIANLLDAVTTQIAWRVLAGRRDCAVPGGLFVFSDATTPAGAMAVTARGSSRRGG